LAQGYRRGRRSAAGERRAARGRVDQPLARSPRQPLIDRALFRLRPFTGFRRQSPKSTRPDASSRPRKGACSRALQHFARAWRSPRPGLRPSVGHPASQATPGGRQALSYMCRQAPEWLGLGPVLPVGAVLDVELLDAAVEPVDPVVAALAIAAPPPASKPAVANVAITAFVDRICMRSFRGRCTGHSTRCR
jgi:hypothetical protein